MQTQYGKLVVLAGTNVGESYDLPGPETIIGRDPTVDIAIPLGSISRRHTRIGFDGQRYFVEDLASSNGTFLNGQRISGRVALNPGDRIDLGQSVSFTFSVPMAATAVSPQAGLGAAATQMEMSATMMQEVRQPGPPPAEPPRLSVTVAGQPAQTYPLTGPVLALGRADDNDIVVRAPIVSRYHARLVKVGAGYELQPLPQASNPVIIGGQPLSGAHLLRDGEQLQIGQPGSPSTVLLTYHAPAGAPAGAGAEATVRAATPEATHRAPVYTQKIDNVLDDVGTMPVPAGTGVGAGMSAPAGGGMHTMMESDFLQSAAALGPPQLDVVIAGATPQTYTLGKARMTIGRAQDNDIVIPSPIVSRHHAYLERVGTSYQLVPLAEASNPVMFAGRPLTSAHRLQHKDLLRIGGQDPGSMVTLNYRSPTEAREVEAAPAIDFSQKNLLTFGRDANNDIVLTAPTVSGFHAQIERVGQRYRVRDLRSSNGTFVNGERIEGEVWLKPNDNVRMGSFRFVMGQDQLAQYDDSGGLRVETIGVNKWVRKDLNILQNISLVFQPREFIVVVGQSGGGKTTLVDAIAGYRPATHGQVRVNNIDVYRSFDAIRNDIGYVPQKDIIHTELTIFQALDYAAQLRMPPDTTKAERHQRVQEVMEDLDLAHRKDTQISRLSGGQQKRVSIGVELLTSPGLFFLDEPTSGLDPGTETALMQLMRRLADQGRTIVLITHATKNVMLADKVVFLARGGHLAWFGPPDEALAYFDQYRTDRERRAREMEFDEIYAILENESLGKAADWGERFKEHPAYQQYVAEPLAHRDLAAQPENVVAAPQPKRKRQVSSLRQLKILSARNLRILTRDRFSLLLMLAAAPIVSMLDVILSLALGRNLFDVREGSIQNVMITLFLLSVYGVMVGGLAQMREIVKEQDIYKRERLVNLRLFPYILSKVWVAALLALYQSFVYVFVHYLVFNMPGSWLEFGLIYITLTLATMSGMMLGLFASAVAPNSNSAPLIVVLLVLPQIVLAGALVPLPGFVTGVTSTRWAYQGFMAITGAGSDVAADACWTLSEEEQKALTTEQKVTNCRCLGPNVLRECNFPGVAASYSSVVDQPPPSPPDMEEPQRPPNPPPEPARPEFPPQPVRPADEADTIAQAEYFDALEKWQAEVEEIQSAFDEELESWRAEVAIIQAQADAYPDQLNAYIEAQRNYQEQLALYEASRAAAILPAEETIRTIYPGFSWTFTNKEDPAAYWGVIGRAWAALGLVNLILFVAIVILQKRKDVTK